MVQWFTHYQRPRVAPDFTVAKYLSQMNTLSGLLSFLSENPSAFTFNDALRWVDLRSPVINHVPDMADHFRMHPAQHSQEFHWLSNSRLNDATVI